MIDWIAGLLVLVGAFFALIASVGVFRLPDVLTRMHASTKAGTLGSTLILIAVALHKDDTSTSVKVIAAILFLIMTAPLAAHAIGRAAVKTGVPMRLRAGSRLPGATASEDAQKERP